MRYTYTILLITSLSYLLTSCAWENLPEGEVKKQRIVQVTMRLGGAMRPDLFYYIVFNLSGDPNKKPYSVFEGEDRGKYWTVYYMWGTPPHRDTDLYRGFGGKSKSGSNLIDKPPIPRRDLIELLPGTVVEGDHMTLVINLTDLPFPETGNVIVNMNMIVCNQAIDAVSRIEYEYEPYVFDSFLNRGISMTLTSVADYWDEFHNQQEHIPNEHEDVAPPEANIVDWRFQIVTR